MDRKWILGPGPLLAFALASAVIIASSFVTFLNIGWISGNEQLVIHSHSVLQDLEALLQSMVQAETSQRGFIITGEELYLSQYRQSLTTADENLNSVEFETSDNPIQQEHIRRLRSAVEARKVSLEEGVAARQMGGVEAGRAFVATGRGRQDMERIRSLIETLRRVERDLLVVRGMESLTSYRTARTTSIMVGMMGMMMVIIAYALAAREVIRRTRASEDLEQQVKWRTTQLSEANSALNTSNKELEQFASVASHDLQEPLRKIEAFGDRLKTRSRDQLDDQARDYLDRVLASASRMRTLISDLLSFSRVATRAQPFVPVDLSRIAAEVVSDLEGRIQDTEGQVDLGPLPQLEADPTQVRQLFQNLLGNALKFHRRDVPPTVKVRGEIVTRSDGRECCRLTFADNGIGFEEQYLDRIFEVFQRLHGRNEFEGTGIGLAICRRIAERHGGNISARSVPNEGSTFIVILPLKQGETGQTIETEAVQ